MESSIRRVHTISQQLETEYCDMSTNNVSDSLFVGDERYKYKNIIVTKNRQDKVALVTMNRPRALNAFSDESISEIQAACLQLDKDDEVHVIVITGNEKAFACGADLKELKDYTFQKMVPHQMIDKIADMKNLEKPLIAAVNGFALGGGCELALICDVVIAGDNAKFSQPEIKIGTLPGAGGTQRLGRCVGKSKAMEMILSGRMISAKEAYAFNLVSHVVPVQKTVETAIQLAKEIASFSLPIIKANKLAVNKSMDLGLREGLEMERALFVSSFAYEDRKEGMEAFSNKRKPNWKNN